MVTSAANAGMVAETHSVIAAAATRLAGEKIEGFIISSQN
jgi:hypothetical protein